MPWPLAQVPLKESCVLPRGACVPLFSLLTEKLKSERQQIEKSMKDLEDNIKNLFDGSTEQLKRDLADFESKVQEREERLLEVSSP